MRRASRDSLPENLSLFVTGAEKVDPRLVRNTATLEASEQLLEISEL
jgi:hypothetical protein